MARWTNGVIVRDCGAGFYAIVTKSGKVLAEVGQERRPDAKQVAELIAEAFNAPDICEMRGINLE